MVQGAGADALGLNFARQSPRFLGPAEAARISDTVRGRLELVGVFVDSTIEEILSVAKRVALDTVQLHGNESPDFLQELSRQISSYKALRIGSAEDVATADGFGSRRILTDAKVEGTMGGTGHAFDWSLIARLNAERDLIVAGGLRPDNVGDCVRLVHPFGIDTASGVEDAPGKKNAEKTRAFVAAARAASGEPKS